MQEKVQKAPEETLEQWLERKKRLQYDWLKENTPEIIPLMREAKAIGMTMTPVRLKQRTS